MINVDELEVAGPYKLNKKLGSNGVVATYEGTSSSGSAVCVVCIAYDQIMHHENWDRVKQAAEHLQTTRPQGVLIPEYWSCEADIYFMAFPFMEGRHLGNLVSEEGLPTPRQSTVLVLKLLDIINNLYQAGISHRSLSPASIFITPQGDPMILHTSWAHLLLSVEGGARHPDMMSILPFLSPEVLDHQTSSLPADIFSLAANYYFLLTGVPIHWADSPDELAKLIINDDVDLSPLKSVVDAMTIDLIEEMLERDPEDRPQNIDALKNRLEMALSNITDAGASKIEDEQTEKLKTTPVGAQPSAHEENYDALYGDLGEEEQAPPPPVIETKPQDSPYDDYEEQTAKDASIESQFEAPRPASHYKSASKQEQQHANLQRAHEAAAQAQEQKRIEEEKARAEESDKARIAFEKKKQALKKTIQLSLLLLGFAIIAGFAYFVFNMNTKSEDKQQEIGQIAQEQREEIEKKKKQQAEENRLMKETESTLNEVGNLARQYINKYGIWPTSISDYNELTDSEDEQFFTDSWGTEFQVRPQGFVLSAGPDQEFGTKDDLWIDSENNSIVHRNEI